MVLKLRKKIQYQTNSFQKDQSPFLPQWKEKIFFYSKGKKKKN